MAEIIIKTSATDEQIAAVAKHLGYQEKVQKEVEVKEMEEVIDPETSETSEVETIRMDIVEEDNPQTDDEYVREKLTESIVNLIWDAFIAEQVKEMEAQKAEMQQASKETLKQSIITEKKW